MDLTAADVTKFLVCQSHLGATACDFQMEQYIWARRDDGSHIINVKKTHDKLVMAARAIAAIENPADICVISARPYGQRAVLKFAAHTGATAIAGRFTPGTFTNQIQKAFKEPRLLVICDPLIDHQAITEASYVNIPVIAFCNTDSPMRYVDIAIPCNNKGYKSVGLMFWMLAREILTIRGQITRDNFKGSDGKEVMVDLYFYRDPEEAEKEEQAEKAPEDDRYGHAMEITQPITDWPNEPSGIPEFNVTTTNINWAEEVEADQFAPAPVATLAPAPGGEWGGGSSW